MKNISKMKLCELQADLDEFKYLHSERAGKDQCGLYKYCEVCNKKNKFPCASAYKKFIKKYENKEVI